MNTIKHPQALSLRSLGCAVCFFALQVHASLPVTAKAAEAPAADTAALERWKQVQASNSRINACRVSWKRVITVKPNPEADPEKAAARSLEQARQEGLGEKEAQEAAQMARREAERDIAGSTVHTLLNFVRIGESVRCDVVQPELDSVGIDFFDGTNSLYVDTKVEGTPVPKNATLQRDPAEVLRHSASHWQEPRFLLGIPLGRKLSSYSPAFDQQALSPKDTPNGAVLLEQKLFPQPNVELAAELTLDKKLLLPVSYKVFDSEITLIGPRVEAGQQGHPDADSYTTATRWSSVEVQRQSRPDWTVSIEDYRKYRDGVWFPSKVTVTEPTSTTVYTLVKAAFNEDVDPMELRLPADIDVADTRFGVGDKIAEYKLTDGVIPSDDKVRQMLHLDKEATAAQDKASREAKSESPTSPIAPATGLMFMAMGSMMWVRSRKEDEGTGRK